MKHIIQKQMNDCGVACLAMLHETSYRCMSRLIKAHFAQTGQKFSGVDYDDAQAVSTLIGSPLRRITKPDENKLIGLKAILVVPCKDGSGEYHGVFWDRDTLYDPSWSKRYGKPGKTAFRVASEAWALPDEE